MQISSWRSVDLILACFCVFVLFEFLGGSGSSKLPFFNLHFCEAFFLLVWTSGEQRGRSNFLLSPRWICTRIARLLDTFGLNKDSNVCFLLQRESEAGNGKQPR